MSEFVGHKVMESARRKVLREAFREMSFATGIDIEAYNAPEFERFVAIYAYGLDYNPDELMPQFNICRKYVDENFRGAHLLYFVDGCPHTPILKNLHIFAKKGRLSAVVCRNIETFRFSNPIELKRHLGPFSKSGVDFRFADDCFETELLRRLGGGLVNCSAQVAAVSASA